MRYETTRQRRVLVEVELPHRTAFRVFGPMLGEGDAYDIVEALSELPGVGAVEVNRWRGEVVCLHGEGVPMAELRGSLLRLLGADSTPAPLAAIA